jgi:hypothetical protein
VIIFLYERRVRSPRRRRERKPKAGKRNEH